MLPSLCPGIIGNEKSVTDPEVQSSGYKPSLYPESRARGQRHFLAADTSFANGSVSDQLLHKLMHYVNRRYAALL